MCSAAEHPPPPAKGKRFERAPQHLNIAGQLRGKLELQVALIRDVEFEPDPTRIAVSHIDSKQPVLRQGFYPPLGSAQSWVQCSQRVKSAVRIIVDMLNNRHAPALFFWMVRRYPTRASRSVATKIGWGPTNSV